MRDTAKPPSHLASTRRTLDYTANTILTFTGATFNFGRCTLHKIGMRTQSKLDNIVGYRPGGSGGCSTIH